jgi:hypothetical protein
LCCDWRRRAGNGSSNQRLHGAGNGLLTIARGTLPLAVFGPIGYGMRAGMLAAPARATQSLGPYFFGLLLDRMGTASITISTILSLSAFFALLALKIRAEAAPAIAKEWARG